MGVGVEKAVNVELLNAAQFRVEPVAPPVGRVRYVQQVRAQMRQIGPAQHIVVIGRVQPARRRRRQLESESSQQLRADLPAQLLG